MKYYPARLEQTHSDQLTALRSIGCSEKVAQQFIANAQIEQSPSIFIPLNDYKGYALTRSPDGTVSLWQACIDPLCDSEQEANEMAREIEQGLKGSKAAGSAWAVFLWTDTLSRRKQ